MLALASDTLNNEFSQTDPPLPALITGFGVIVNTISSLTLPHGVFPYTVMVSVMFPVSLAPGIYVGVKVVEPVIVPVAPEFAVQSIEE